MGVQKANKGVHKKKRFPNPSSFLLLFHIHILTTQTVFQIPWSFSNRPSHNTLAITQKPLSSSGLYNSPCPRRMARTEYTLFTWLCHLHLSHRGSPKCLVQFFMTINTSPLTAENYRQERQPEHTQRGSQNPANMVCANANILQWSKLFQWGLSQDSLIWSFLVFFCIIM